jgi:hypothetical protein
LGATRSLRIVGEIGDGDARVSRRAAGPPAASRLGADGARAVCQKRRRRGGSERSSGSGKFSVVLPRQRDGRYAPPPPFSESVPPRWRAHADLPPQAPRR